MAARAVPVHGITYRTAELNRSELYLAFLPLVNSGRVDLLDNTRMVAQFVGLERRTSRAGKDSVDHAPGAHDDVSNSVAGVASLASVVRPTVPLVAPIFIGREEARSSAPGSPYYMSGQMDSVYADKRQSGFSRRAVF